MGPAFCNIFTRGVISESGSASWFFRLVFPFLSVCGGINCQYMILFRGSPALTAPAFPRGQIRSRTFRHTMKTREKRVDWQQATAFELSKPYLWYFELVERSRGLSFAFLSLSTQRDRRNPKVLKWLDYVVLMRKWFVQIRIKVVSKIDLHRRKSSLREGDKMGRWFQRIPRLHTRGVKRGVEGKDGFLFQEVWDLRQLLNNLQGIDGWKDQTNIWIWIEYVVCFLVQ